ncbi:hypothetical protein PG991_011965 [Apiospora marii]|uniref:Uncharacterized protein n=1 Tax=Apiospora marii TaxID=335849 RepID=A0ABR1RFN5_9PEZI
MPLARSVAPIWLNAFMAPRYLKDPPFWRFSSFNSTRGMLGSRGFILRPSRLESSRERMHGVLVTELSSRSWAWTMLSYRRQREEA